LDSIEADIKRLIAAAIWPRLFVIRLRHFFIDLVPLVKNWKHYCHAVACFDEFAHPIISGLGWLFHGVRLFITIIYLLKHTIPGQWMEQREREMGWKARLETQVQLHWFQIANDTIWVISTLAPSLLLLTVGISLFEMLITTLHSLVEINRIKGVLGELESTMNHDTMTNKDEGDDGDACKQYLLHCISHEQKKLILRIINIISISALILLKSSLPILMPSVALNPIIPFVIAALLLTITLVCYLLGKWLERHKPSDKVRHLTETDKTTLSSRFTFFSSKGKKKITEVEPEQTDFYRTSPNMVINEASL
jgi:hypothetical protein